jgi:methylated-DNA-[protein]-cysteine S-methyltransferase
MNASALYSYYSSPFGELLLTSDGEALTGLHLPRHDGSPAPLTEPDSGWRRDDRAFGDVCDQLRAYFAGERFAFDLPMRMTGTPFQRLAWNGLLTIPFGATVSYAEQARRIGRPAASRAVGAANGRNPIAIIVPCHRVIGSDGSLTGYGGGLDLKRGLLQFEAEMLGDAAPAHSVRKKVAASVSRG